MSAHSAALLSPKTQASIAIEDQYGAHNYHPLDIVIAEAKGVWVTDVDGNRFLDCLSAYSAVNQGHCHPKLLQTLIEQAHKVTLTSRAFRNDQLPRLYETLHRMTGYDMALPMNSGAEAVETAIKMARKWGYHTKGIPANQAEMIVCTNNFHGRTTTIVGFSTEPDYQDGFGPFTPGFVIVPYGDAEALAKAITPNTCAFMVEPIQGEAGVVIPPDGYLAQAAALCKANNVLFIADEIQCGLGRAGKLFAYEYEGIRPDAVIIGKALSGGFYPVSAVLADEPIMRVFQPGQHGSTFGGNPLGCAVAVAALNILQDEALIERSARLGAVLKSGLEAIESPIIKEVRGKGLMVGIECTVPVRATCEQLKARGVLCKETHSTVIRVTPPLVIDEADLHWAIEQFQAVLSAATA